MYLKMASYNAGHGGGAATFTGGVLSGTVYVPPATVYYVDQNGGGTYTDGAGVTHSTTSINALYTGDETAPGGNHHGAHTSGGAAYEDVIVVVEDVTFDNSGTRAVFCTMKWYPAGSNGENGQHLKPFVVKNVRLAEKLRTGSITSASCNNVGTYPWIINTNDRNLLIEGWTVSTHNVPSYQQSEYWINAVPDPRPVNDTTAIAPAFSDFADRVRYVDISGTGDGLSEASPKSFKQTLHDLFPIPLTEAGWIARRDKEYVFVLTEETGFDAAQNWLYTYDIKVHQYMNPKRNAFLSCNDRVIGLNKTIRYKVDTPTFFGSLGVRGADRTLAICDARMQWRTYTDTMTFMQSESTATAWKNGDAVTGTFATQSAANGLVETNQHPEIVNMIIMLGSTPMPYTPIYESNYFDGGGTWTSGIPHTDGMSYYRLLSSSATWSDPRGSPCTAPANVANAASQSWDGAVDGAGGSLTCAFGYIVGGTALNTGAYTCTSGEWSYGANVPTCDAMTSMYAVEGAAVGGWGSQASPANLDQVLGVAHATTVVLTEQIDAAASFTANPSAGASANRFTCAHTLTSNGHALSNAPVDTTYDNRASCAFWSANSGLLGWDYIDEDCDVPSNVANAASQTWSATAGSLTCVLGRVINGTELRTQTYACDRNTGLWPFGGAASVPACAALTSIHVVQGDTNDATAWGTAAAPMNLDKALGATVSTSTTTFVLTEPIDATASFIANTENSVSQRRFACTHTRAGHAASNAAVDTTYGNRVSCAFWNANSGFLGWDYVDEDCDIPGVANAASQTWSGTAGSLTCVLGRVISGTELRTQTYACDRNTGLWPFGEAAAAPTCDSLTSVYVVQGNTNDATAWGTSAAPMNLDKALGADVSPTAAFILNETINAATSFTANTENTVSQRRFACAHTLTIGDFTISNAAVDTTYATRITPGCAFYVSNSGISGMDFVDANCVSPGTITNQNGAGTSWSLDGSSGSALACTAGYQVKEGTSATLELARAYQCDTNLGLFRLNDISGTVYEPFSPTCAFVATYHVTQANVAASLTGYKSGSPANFNRMVIALVARTSAGTTLTLQTDVNHDTAATASSTAKTAVPCDVGLAENGNALSNVYVNTNYESRGTCGFYSANSGLNGWDYVDANCVAPTISNSNNNVWVVSSGADSTVNCDAGYQVDATASLTGTYQCDTNTGLWSYGGSVPTCELVTAYYVTDEVSGASTGYTSGSPINFEDVVARAADESHALQAPVLKWTKTDIGHKTAAGTAWQRTPIPCGVTLDSNGETGARLLNPKIRSYYDNRTSCDMYAMITNGTFGVSTPAAHFTYFPEDTCDTDFPDVQWGLWSTTNGTYATLSCYGDAIATGGSALLTCDHNTGVWGPNQPSGTSCTVTGKRGGVCMYLGRGVYTIDRTGKRPRHRIYGACTLACVPVRSDAGPAGHDSDPGRCRDAVCEFYWNRGRTDFRGSSAVVFRVRVPFRRRDQHQEPRDRSCRRRGSQCVSSHDLAAHRVQHDDQQRRRNGADAFGRLHRLPGPRRRVRAGDFGHGRDAEGPDGDVHVTEPVRERRSGRRGDVRFRAGEQRDVRVLRVHGVRRARGRRHCSGNGIVWKRDSGAKRSLRPGLAHERGNNGGAVFR